MRKYFAFALIFFAACSSPKKPKFEGHVGVQKVGPGEYMFLETTGDKLGYSAFELDEIARSYIKEKKVPFELDGTERNIWIQTDGSPTMAKVYFGSGPAHPTLQVDIGRDGKVKRHIIHAKTGG
jgi:hypothetical protein